MNERDCDWTGELGEFDSHVHLQNGKCLYVDVTCPNSCGESHQRHHIDSHLSDMCLHPVYIGPQDFYFWLQTSLV